MDNSIKITITAVLSSTTAKRLTQFSMLVKYYMKYVPLKGQPISDLISSPLKFFSVDSIF